MLSNPKRADDSVLHRKEQTFRLSKQFGIPSHTTETFHQPISPSTLLEISLAAPSITTFTSYYSLSATCQGVQSLIYIGSSFNQNVA